VLVPVGYDARAKVRRGTYFKRNLVFNEIVDEAGILDRTNAVPDPFGPEGPDRPPDALGSGFLAGMSGIIWAYFRPGVGWDMGFQLLLLTFAAVTLGGLGTAFGALVGALIVGFFVEMSTLIIPSDTKYVGALIILILVLLVRPQGILGRKERIG